MFSFLIAASVFSLVFTCSLYALQQSGLAPIRFPLAVCVGVLSVLGLFREVSTSSGEPSFLIHVVLIPYALLALFLLAILFMLLGFIAGRLLRRYTRRERHRARREIGRREAKRPEDRPHGQLREKRQTSAQEQDRKLPS